MIATSLTIISALVILIIFLAKTLNVLKLGQLFDKNIILLTAITAGIFWLICFFGFSATIAFEEISTVIDNTNPDITITTINNDFFITSLFFLLSTILMLATVLMTIAEGLLLFPNLLMNKTNKTL